MHTLNAVSKDDKTKSKDDAAELSADSPSPTHKHDIESEVNSSVAIVGLVTFVGDCARGILFPVLWPLCQSLGGSKVDYGYLVAIFSVGRLVITSRMGIISDKYRHRAALLLSGVILCLGAALWGSVQFIGPLAVLYVAQFTMGLGTGSLGVTRSYVAEQVAPAQRTYMLARLSALQYGGFAATPLLGSALVIAGASVSTTMEYALPGYLVLFLSLVYLGLLYYPFQDIKDMYEHSVERAVQTSTVLSSTTNPMRSHTSDSSANLLCVEENNATSPVDTEDPLSARLQSTHVAHSGADSKAEIEFASPEQAHNKKLRNRVFMLMMFFNFTTRGGIAVYETQGSQILLDQYHMPQWELGLLVSMAGLIGTVQLIFFKQFWCKHFSDIELMLGGLGLFAVAQLLVINWGPDHPTPVWRYVLSMYLVYAFAYPISNSAVLGVFSSLQKAGKQARAQGHFAFMGSLARVIMPIVTGYLETNVEYSASFALVLILLSASIAGALLLHHEIVFFSSPVLASTVCYDPTASQHRIGLATIVTVCACCVSSLVALLTMLDWGVRGW